MTKIPKITNEKLAELRKRIRPVAKFAKGTEGLFDDDRGTLYFMKVNSDARNVSYFWDRKAAEKCKGLKFLKTIETLHTTGGFFFKPSEAEVLAQLPEDCLDVVVGYEIVNYGITSGYQYCFAEVKLYTK